MLLSTNGKKFYIYFFVFKKLVFHIKTLRYVRLFILFLVFFINNTCFASITNIPKPGGYFISLNFSNTNPEKLFVSRLNKLSQMYNKISELELKLMKLEKDNQLLEDVKNHRRKIFNRQIVSIKDNAEYIKQNYIDSEILFYLEHTPEISKNNLSYGIFGYLKREKNLFKNESRLFLSNISFFTKKRFYNEKHLIMSGALGTSFHSSSFRLSNTPFVQINCLYLNKLFPKTNKKRQSSFRQKNKKTKQSKSFIERLNFLDKNMNSLTEISFASDIIEPFNFRINLSQTIIFKNNYFLQTSLFTSYNEKYNYHYKFYSKKQITFAKKLSSNIFKNMPDSIISVSIFHDYYGAKNYKISKGISCGIWFEI